MAKVYIYVVARDFGFAPNPYHGVCSLATCKPAIRSTAQVGDWIFGVGGSGLKATGKCIYAMRVTKKITFNEYWFNPQYNDKKPVRNGSKRMVVGDNIYYYDEKTQIWHQAHSHHSMSDGTINKSNLLRDTSSQNVLLSKYFFYFGLSAPVIPEDILKGIKYENRIGHRKFDTKEAYRLIEWIEDEHFKSLNLVVAKPYNFDNSSAHYSVETNKISL
ncbi:MAG: hypothetical protein EOO89_13455 [Pedobacter sp.]|nr:MAG: hypothetical protein EOO89_13455 [Pedobacter sp.]